MAYTYTQLAELVASIKYALATDKDGEALVEVARNAQRAEYAAAHAKKQVTVEVYGGVAEVTECPNDVGVEIIDHDNKNED